MAEIGEIKINLSTANCPFTHGIALDLGLIRHIRQRMDSYSSDLVNPPKPQPDKGRRKHGAQPGHPKHERQPFAPEEINHFENDRLDCCPDCSGEVQLLDQPASILQQVELIEKPVLFTEHRSFTCHREECEKNFTAPIPADIQNAA